MNKWYVSSFPSPASSVQAIQHPNRNRAHAKCKSTGSGPESYRNLLGEKVVSPQTPSLYTLASYYAGFVQ